MPIVALKVHVGGYDKLFMASPRGLGSEAISPTFLSSRGTRTGHWGTTLLPVKNPADEHAFSIVWRQVCCFELSATIVGSYVPNRKIAAEHSVVFPPTPRTA